MKYLAVIIAIFMITPVFGQRNKKGDEPEAPVIVEGVVYSLPRTVIRLEVKAVKETFVPGPYAAYAEQLLGIRDAKTRPSVNWTITGVKIETATEPDPDQVHKAMGDVASQISLTPDGCIAGINVENIQTVPVTVKTNILLQKPEKAGDFSFDYITDSPFFTTGDSINNYRPVKVSPEQKMVEAARRVLDSRRLQYDIAAGLMDEFHPDGEAYEESLKELKNIERKYQSLFTGKTTVTGHEFSVDFVPKSPGAKGEVIFRISDENGVVPASDLSGKPVMIEFEVENKLMENYLKLAKSENPAAGESGIYYRIPGMANIKIISDLKVIATSRLPVAQFGVIAPVPENLLDGSHVIRFHPETGAIQSVTKK